MPGALNAGNLKNSIGALPPIPDQSPQAAQSPLQMALPPPMPAPSYGETVTALRHFRAVIQKLKSLLTNPDLGSSDIKSLVIDGVTDLVADRMMTPGDAISELSDFPTRPFDQKTWVQQNLVQAMQARNAVLAHHAAAFGGVVNPVAPPNPDHHMTIMAGMMKRHYPKRGAV